MINLDHDCYCELLVGQKNAILNKKIHIILLISIIRIKRRGHRFQKISNV
jgi:hypothetical protein